VGARSLGVGAIAALGVAIWEEGAGFDPHPPISRIAVDMAAIASRRSIDFILSRDDPSSDGPAVGGSMSLS
jgi:hypothetical protein